MYAYTPLQWLLVFYIYSFCGWVFESIVVSVQQRRFVNRGFLKGPLLPIYGFGATIILHVSLPLLGHPAAVYAAGLVTATAFEYAVGVLMEALFKVKYWDYSEHRFQFQGRICLDSSIAWGFLSLLLAYVLHRPAANFITGLPPQAAAAAGLTVSIWFVCDTVISSKAAFEFAGVLKELEKLRAEADELRLQLQLGVYEAQDLLKDLRAQIRQTQEDLHERAVTAQDELHGRLEAAKAELRARTNAEEDAHALIRRRLAAAEAAIAEHLRHRERHYRALLRANPSARSSRFSEVLRLWRDREKP